MEDATIHDWPNGGTAFYEGLGRSLYGRPQFLAPAFGNLERDALFFGTRKSLRRDARVRPECIYRVTEYGLEAVSA